MQKYATGVEGLDHITDAGLPRGRLTAVVGAAGAGKSILALQILAHAAKARGENSVFVAFEETHDEILDNIKQQPWSNIVCRAGDKKKPKECAVQIVDANLDPDAVYAGAFDLEGLLAIVANLVRETDAKLVAFDAINVLLDMLDDPRDRRREILRIQRWVRETAVSALMTLTPPGQAEAWAGYGFVSHAASSVVVLSSINGDRGFERGVQVTKHRGSSHAPLVYPFSIEKGGFEVREFAYSPIKYDAPLERISTGIARLDHMLGGGIHRASSVLVSGAPGTAKTTIAGNVALARCERGEKTLFVSYDEAIAQIVRNLASVGLAFAPYIANGMFVGEAFRPGRFGGRAHYYQLRELIDREQPRCLIIDPVSALQDDANSQNSTYYIESLIDYAKARGVTIVMTSLLDGPAATEESTRAKISSIADTWIHLSFAVEGGERNRALTIVKSRGDAHSNQVRELTLSHDGVSLTDVYLSAGNVLMGTARAERERADAETDRLRRNNYQREIRETEQLEAQLANEISGLKAKLDAVTARRKELTEQERITIKAASEGVANLKLRRGADGEK